MKSLNLRLTLGRLGVASPALLILFAGCSAGQFGSELSAQPKPRQLKQTAGTTIHLPQDQPFNITLPTATRKPGLNGTATADATAEATGSATAAATVNNGGTAEAVFQLGHALCNATERQADFECRVRFQYELEVQAASALKLPDAVVGLRLYARNDRGRLLREMPLVAYTTEDGPAQRRSSDDVGFTLTLGPGETVNLFLAGQAKVEVPDGRSGSSSVKLNGLTMDVTTRPAPAVRTAGHEQG